MNDYHPAARAVLGVAVAAGIGAAAALAVRQADDKRRHRALMAMMRAILTRPFYEDADDVPEGLQRHLTVVGSDAPG